MRDVREIAALARGVSGPELTFGQAEALRAVALCTNHEIAVLGVEFFDVVASGLQARGWSDYDVGLLSPTEHSAWFDYVVDNNAKARELIEAYEWEVDQVCVLTAVTWDEFVRLPS